MAFTTIEIIALFLIIISLVKIVVILIKPEEWVNFAKKLYLKPKIITAIFLLLAALTLYALVSSGVGIITILAVTLFVAFLVGASLAPYLGQLITTIDPDDIVKRNWWYIIIWVALLVWGIIALL
jgi:hypothetical protein